MHLLFLLPETPFPPILTWLVLSSSPWSLLWPTYCQSLPTQVPLRLLFLHFIFLCITYYHPYNTLFTLSVSLTRTQPGILPVLFAAIAPALQQCLPPSKYQQISVELTTSIGKPKKVVMVSLVGPEHYFPPGFYLFLMFKDKNPYFFYVEI